ncbi:MAG: hypothetical protein RIB71_12125 [Imperialibacter sp.]|uniref:hypothetical protein n=1 Tax=Imperialibacter sp. TaxID=2038411 RepID=UPI0032EE58C8
MVTFRQVARAYTSAAREAERQQKRQQKEAARQFREQQKDQEIQDATEAFEQYENYVEIITSFHKNCAEKVDWNQVRDEQEPPKPEKQSLNEDAAALKLSSYKPSFLDKIIGAKKKLGVLEEELKLAKIKDDQDLATAKQNYSEWEKTQALAKGVLAKDPQAYADALNYFEPFSEISDIGTNIDLSIEKDIVEIEFLVNDTGVIPDFVITLTSTGKLSRKDMPKGRSKDLYQQYVCGAVLRLAREALAYLPVKIIAVHAMAKMVNPATGYLEDAPIVSAIIPDESVEKLNFEALTPSAAMNNFVHNMKFSKTNGFSQVDKVILPGLSEK